MILIALMLSACSAYPKIDWPAGPAAGAAPALLPQSEILGATGAMGVASDPSGVLVARAAALRGWAGSVAR
jgi:hypothetical protein